MKYRIIVSLALLALIAFAFVVNSGRSTDVPNAVPVAPANPTNFNL